MAPTVELMVAVVGVKHNCSSRPYRLVCAASQIKIVDVS